MHHDKHHAAYVAFAAFQDKFNAAAMGVSGSGWGWLVYGERGGLALTSLPNQDSLISHGLVISCGDDKERYFERFNALISATDILGWRGRTNTKSAPGVSPGPTRTGWNGRRTEVTRASVKVTA